MSDTQRDLFPFILDVLSHHPMLAESENNLLKDLKEKLKDEGIRIPNLKKELDAAIEIGVGLGILSSNNEGVRLGFSLNEVEDETPTRHDSAPGTSRSKSKEQSSKTKNSNMPEEESNSRRGRRQSPSITSCRSRSHRSRSRRRRRSGRSKSRSR